MNLNLEVRRFRRSISCLHRTKDTMSIISRRCLRDVMGPPRHADLGFVCFESSCRANGSDAKLHGQGPRAEASAARGALHVRRANARRVTPCGFDSNEPARPAARSRAVPASAAS